MKLLIISLLLILSLSQLAVAQKRNKSGLGTRSPATSRTPVQPAEGDAARLPVGYLGHSAANIFTALRAARGVLRKSQFETTPDYEGRVEKIVSALPGAGSRLTFLMPDMKISYDADASAFKIEADTETAFPDIVYVSGDWMSHYDRFTSFYLAWTNRTVGTRVGQNAFGVRRRYRITTYTSLRLAVPAASVTKIVRGLRLPATPSSARVMYPWIRVALTGRLIPPYGAEETSVDEATISDLEEAHYFKYYIYFEPDTVVVYDIRTGEVYGTADLAEQQSDGSRPRLSYSGEPIVLEDPLERAQRMEESRREYPPDHVFKPSEVTKKAEILTRPTPSFTSEARSAGVSGPVVLRVVLKSDGSVEVLSAIKELPMGLTERAIEAAKQIRFNPAVRNGKLVSQEIILEYNFSLY